jgi:type II secretory pathway pseudopilin PulG
VLISMRNRGQSLVELLLAVGLAFVIMPALITGFVASREGKATQSLRLEATALLKEAVEAVRSVRTLGWESFAVNGTYHPVISGANWSLTAGTETINDLERSIVISDVNRDTNGDIIATGGSVDPSTKKVVITIAWTSPLSSSVETTLYLTRHDNQTYTETTEVEFNEGTPNDVIITNDEGGEVTLGGGGSSDWCEPDLTIAALDLPKNGVANGLTVIEGEAFAGTGENASGVSFADVLVSNTDPPEASIISTFDGYKTNDIFGEADYVYIATDTNSKEIVILQVSSTPFTEVGYFNASGSDDANAVFVVGNTGYMVQGDKLWNFDLSSKTGSRAAIDSDGVTLSGTGSKMYIVGDYVYVALTSSGREMEIVDISDPEELEIVGYADIDPQGQASGEAGQDVFVNSNGTRAYLGTNNQSAINEFYIIDVSTKTGSRSTIGSYDTGSMSPKGVTVVTGNKAIAVGSSGEEYQVINITNESSPVRCGGLQVDTGINGVASILEADGDVYSYIITGDASSEFKIIEGGPGGNFTTSGSFESRTFDASATAAFNRFNASYVEPVSTEVKFQFAIADAVSGSCNGAAFTYLGPDGTAGSYYFDDDDIYLNNDGNDYDNPARCLRYKVFLSTSDTTQSPVFNDITINYSP